MSDINILPHFEPFLEDWTHVVALDGRGTGKSKNAHSTAVHLADNCKMKILCLRELQNSIDDSSKAEIEEAIEESGKSHRWIIQQKYIKNKVTGSMFLFRGVNSKPKKLKSLKGVDLVIFEECEDATEEAIRFIIPTFSRNPAISFWWLGNVSTRGCAIAQMFIENDPPPNTKVIRSTYLENPYLPKTFLDEANYLKEKNEKMYRHVYLGEYYEDESLFLVPRCEFGTANKYPNDLVVFCVDIAREGGDRTAIAIRCGLNIVRVNPYYSMNLDKLVFELSNLIREFKPDIINVDSTGHGAWVPDALKAHNILVRGVCFSENAWHEDKYRNKRTELYSLYNTFFDGGGKINPSLKWLEREVITASGFTYDNKNRPALKPKKEISKDLGESPDGSDAVGLCLVTHGIDMFIKPHQIILNNSQNMTQNILRGARW